VNSHFFQQLIKDARVIFPGAAEQLAGFLARGYTMMLMGLRSDPRFWDNPDTRVTFQNVACLAQALVDMSAACTRWWTA